MNNTKEYIRIIIEVTMIETWTDEQIEEQRLINMQEDNIRRAMEAWEEY